MYNNNDPLKLAKDALDKAIETEKKNKAFMASVGPAIISALTPTLNAIKQAVSNMKVDVQPVIKVNPEIKYPPITIPPIPPFPKIPPPIINYTPPDIKLPDLMWPKGEMPISGDVRLLGINLTNPLPVQIRDSKGNELDFSKIGGGGGVMIGGGGGRGDFYTIADIQTSAGASVIDQKDGAVKVVGIVSIGGATGSIAAAIVDSTGQQYSGSNPLPVSATLTLPSGQGDSATATRFVQAGDSVSSVYVNNPVAQGDAATALRVVIAGNADASVVVNNPQGLGDAATALRVTLAGNASASMSVLDFNGNAPALGTNETVNGVLRVISMSDTASSSQTKLVAMTTLPTAASDAASTFQRSDKYGREINRPIQVRDLISTAYVSLSTGTEATFLAAVAGQTFDLIWILLSNQSTAAVQVDVRPILAGNVALTFQVPANGTVGIAPPVPYPGSSDTGNAWTVDMPDITGTTVNITGLFSREI